MSLRAWSGESGCISGFSGLGALTLAALRGMRASLTAFLKGLVERHVDVVDGAGGETAVQLLAVEAADVVGGESA